MTILKKVEMAEDGKTYEVTYTESSRRELGNEDKMKTILSNCGLDDSQVEDAILEMKAKKLL